MKMSKSDLEDMKKGFLMNKTTEIIKGRAYNKNSNDGSSISFYCCICLDYFCTCCSGQILFECNDCGYALCTKHQTDIEIKLCPNCKSDNIFYEKVDKNE